MSTRLCQEVWDLERCSGCGACVAACSKGVLYWDGAEHPQLEERTKVLGLSQIKLRTCEVCERFCEISCPRLVEQVPLEAQAVRAAQSTGVVHSGTPSAVVRSLLVAARSQDLIDAAVILDVDPWTLEPRARVAESVEEMVSGLGLQHLWAPVLSSLNEAIFERLLSRLAVVGPPCVAEGARRMRDSEHARLWPYQQAIRLIIAPFCTGVYKPEMITELLERGMGIPRDRIQALTTSVADGTMVVTLHDGTERVVALTEVEPFTRRGCGRCDDYLGESADIAVGTVGAQPGWSTVIARTPAGEMALHNAERCGLLKTDTQVDARALEAAALEKDRRQRAQAFDRFRILMLDALTDPLKLAQVRRQFVELYGAPQTKREKKEECHVNCNQC